MGRTRKTKLVDISCNYPIAIYPDSKEILFENNMNMIEDGVNSSYMQWDLHYGTHIDSPLHWIKNGTNISKFPMSLMNNYCQIIIVPDGNLTKNFLENIELNSDVLFFRFNNKSIHTEFDPNYFAVDLSAAEYLVEKNIKFIGTDYLSIEKFKGDGSVHKKLLENNIWIIECLELSQISENIYEYFCFPLEIESESSPVRIMIKTKIDNETKLSLNNCKDS